MKHSSPRKSSVLVIYTGGTIGMAEDPVTGQLRPLDFERIFVQIPELKKFNVDISSVSFGKPMDSSDMTPEEWVRLAEMIGDHYSRYDGFVILHGSDTMAYTASALSFLLENLGKPVILTGSQLPIGVIRTDGKENFITAIEIAAARKNGRPAVPEVAVYFEYRLYRGNRTHKYNAEHFKAFESANYPMLARAGVTIKYNSARIMKPSGKALKVHNSLCADIAVIRLFPGITPSTLMAILNTPGIRAVAMETFGAGNAPSAPWFLDLIEKTVRKGISVLNITQCNSGTVQMGRYETSYGLKKAGVVSGRDMTIEAAVTKLMFLLAQKHDRTTLERLLQKSLRGELTDE